MSVGATVFEGGGTQHDNGCLEARNLRGDATSLPMLAPWEVWSV